jgi:hypothetical protein
MPDSKAQVRAAYAALSGKSNVGMPETAAREIIAKTHDRGGMQGLPERASSRKRKEKKHGKKRREYHRAK